jgi:predicted peptidase
MMISKYFFSILIALILCTLPSWAERIAIKDKTQYPFMLQLPSMEVRASKPPLVVFLHGRSLSGTDLNRVERYGVLYSIDRGKTDLPAIVVAPQSKGGWNPDKVLEIIDYVIENYDADPQRVYVCGMSMGAYGTMDVAGKYPDRIAAAVAICGGGSPKYACNLTKVPLWVQHGTNDRAVPASESKKIVNAIKACSEEANVTLTLINGGTHGSVERLFHQKDIYEWMFNFSKPTELITSK